MDDRQRDLVAAHVPQARALCDRYAARYPWARRPEALSHCYLALIDLAGTWDGRGSFAGYVDRYLAFRAVDHVRREARRSGPIEEATDTFPGRGARDDRYEIAEILVTLERIVGARDARIVRDVVIDGYPMRETGRRVGLSESGVSLRTRRALRTLRRRWPR